MNNERDALANIIKPAAAYDYWPQKAAELALAAGYRKPQQITTVEELDALPIKSTVLDSDGDAFQRIDQEDADGALWIGLRIYTSSKYISLPATVLHVGGDD